MWAPKSAEFVVKVRETRQKVERLTLLLIYLHSGHVASIKFGRLLVDRNLMTIAALWVFRKSASV